MTGYCKPSASPARPRSRRDSCRRSQRDAAGFLEALRGRGVEVTGVRGRAALLSPLLASSLERGLNLAEAMEARGYGGPGRTSIPATAWRARDSRARPLAAASWWRGRCGSSARREADVHLSEGGRARRSDDVSVDDRAGEVVGRLRHVRLRASRLCCAPSQGSCRTSTAVASRGAWRSAAVTRASRPPGGAGGNSGAAVFQDPEEQIVLTHVTREVAFGLENLGTSPEEILAARTRSAAQVGVEHLAERAVTEVSAESCSASVSLRHLHSVRSCCLLDEPTSQLDPVAADAFLELVAGLGIAVLISEQRPRGSRACDRVIFLDGGVLLDATVSVAKEWLAENRPIWLVVRERPCRSAGGAGVSPAGVGFAYRAGLPVVDGSGSSSVVARSSRSPVRTARARRRSRSLPPGCSSPTAGTAECEGRAAMLLQDPARYSIRERVDEEVALGVRRRSRACPQRSWRARARRYGAAASARPVERRARTARPRVGARDRPGPARAGRADARRRSSAQGGAGRAAARRRRPPRATLLVTHDEEFAARRRRPTIMLGQEAVIA